MYEVQELIKVDFCYVFISVLIMFASLKFIISLFDWGMNRLGIETKAMRQRREEHDLIIKTSEELNKLKGKHEESVKESNRQDEIIKQDISNLADTVNGIVDTLADMQQKIDNTEMATLKDKILLYYKKYKDIGEWDEFESEVFWGLYDSYISHGGNSFVKNEIAPVMRDLHVNS